MAASKFLTIVSVLRDGSHRIFQAGEPLPGNVGVLVGSHAALRRRELGEDLVSVVVINGDDVTEHVPAG